MPKSGFTKKQLFALYTTNLAGTNARAEASVPEDQRQRYDYEVTCTERTSSTPRPSEGCTTRRSLETLKNSAGLHQARSPVRSREVTQPAVDHGGSSVTMEAVPRELQQLKDSLHGIPGKPAATTVDEPEDGHFSLQTV